MKGNSPAFRAVILAGGSGERFWPLSTPERPKQFLRVFGGESLIRQTLARLKGIAGAKDVYVVTSAKLAAATRRELPELAAANVVGEPERRDTAAAVALGVGAAAGTGRAAKADPVVGFFPSDQMVMAPERFRSAVRRAAAIAAKSRSIVVVGIRPGYPSTSFGYINPKTGAFFEKPSASRAKAYLREGYLWNAGMFIARASVFKALISEHAPGLAVLLGGVPAPAALRRIYAALPRISFDFAVMEKAKGIRVVPGDFGWDDVGSYGAFDRYFPHDRSGNVREGPCTVVDAEGNICVARSARISLLGVKNLVVVTTPDSVLVADKSRVAEMKKLFAK